MNAPHRSRIGRRLPVEIPMADPISGEGILVDLMFIPDHFAENPPYRRSERETGSLLAILDELEPGRGEPR